MIEQIDCFLVKLLRTENLANNPEAEMNSETPGNIIDRLSINALKIYHMDEETRRLDAYEDHRIKTEKKLSILREQRDDLGNCLFKLLDDLYSLSGSTSDFNGSINIPSYLFPVFANREDILPIKSIDIPFFVLICFA